MELTSKIETVKTTINDALHDQTKPWYELLSWAELHTGIPRFQLMLVATFLVGFYLLIGHGSMMLSNIIGFAYPAHTTIEVLETHSRGFEEASEDCAKWLTYWMIFIATLIVEHPFSGLFYLMPLYYLLKTVFFIWCFVPIANNGSAIIYTSVLRPLLTRVYGTG